MEEHPAADIEGLLDAVYGLELPDGLRSAARLSLGALVDFIRDGGTS